MSAVNQTNFLWVFISFNFVPSRVIINIRPIFSALPIIVGFLISHDCDISLVKQSQPIIFCRQQVKYFPIVYSSDQKPLYYFVRLRSRLASRVGWSSNYMFIGSNKRKSLLKMYPFSWIWYLLSMIFTWHQKNSNPSGADWSYNLKSSSLVIRKSIFQYISSSCIASKCKIKW